MFAKVKNTFGIKILLVLAMMGWGLVWALSKVLLEYASPAQVACVRFLIVSICFIPLFFVLKISFKIPPKAYAPLAFTSLFHIAYSYAMYAGMEFGDAGSAGVITEVLPPIIAAFLWSVWRKQSLLRREKWGLALGILAGAFLTNLFGDISAIFHPFNAIYLFASLGWAFVMIGSRLASENLNPLCVNFYICIISALAFLPSLFMLDSSGVSGFSKILEADFIFWVSIITAALFCTVFSTSVFYHGLFVLGVTQGGIYALLTPVFALIFAYFILGEIPQYYTIVGGVLAVGSVCVINRIDFGIFTRKKPQKT
ncbi:DMT family transporter [Helicobacter sp. T3_23-1059]